MLTHKCGKMYVDATIIPRFFWSSFLTCVFNLETSSSGNRTRSNTVMGAGEE